MRKELLVATFAAEKSPEATGRRKDLVFYSGAEIERYDFWNDEEYTIQFSMEPKDVRLEFLNGAPLLKDHWRSVDSVAGHIENPRLEKGKALATAVFSDTPDTDSLWAKVESGDIRAVSMGVAIDELKLTNEDRKKGEKRRYMAYGWQPEEISLVTHGADPDARFMLSADQNSGFPAEWRHALREIITQHLAKTGAASTADLGRERALATMLLRQRQHGYSHL